MIPEQIGRYRILAKLGAGDMGEVFLAEDTRLGRKVALKLLAEELTQNRDRLSRFDQEAYAASALNHPHILTIFEMGNEAGRHYIATEYIDGSTLRKRLSDTPMDLSEVLDIAIQVASALEEAHAAGIVHRDIKPENIMLRRNGDVKVLDFGLAKLIERSYSEEPGVEPVTRALLQEDPGVVVGTAEYMSPEQARGKPVDARTDIWSLGVVLYEMAAGCAPFSGDSNTGVIVAITKTDPMPLARFSPNIPAEFERIVLNALRKNVDERYQTVKELKLDLKKLKQRLEFQTELETSMAPERYSTARAAPVDTEVFVAARRGTPSAVQATGSSTAQTSASSAEYIVSEIKRHKIGALLAVLAVISVFVALFGLMRPSGPPLQTPIHPRDGDPPRLELASQEIRSAIDDQINDLKPGQILFNPAKEMRVGVVETIEVRIATSFTNDLEKGLKGKGRPQIEQIKMSSYMGVVLSGTEGFFNIELKNREQKIVTQSGYTEWIFDVTPLRQGNPSLYLTAYNVLLTPAGEKSYEHPALSREIKVTTTLGYTVAGFLKGNWKEIIGLIITSGLVGWILNKLRKRRDQRFPPWERP